MNEAIPSASSIANDKPAPASVRITGPGGATTWVENSLRSIYNDKLPAAYQSRAELQVHEERLSLSLDGTDCPLVPRPAASVPITSLVREGRVLAESEPMCWEPVQDIQLSRSVRLTHADLCQVQVSLRVRFKNAGTASPMVSLGWRLSIPPCEAFTYGSSSYLESRCEPGELPREHYLQGSLLFSFDSRRLLCPDNRLLGVRFCDFVPYRAQLARDPAGPQVLTAWFNKKLEPGESATAVIDLTYVHLLRHQVSPTVFLVARPDSPGALWQGAVAAVSSWVDRLEVCRGQILCGPGFRRFAPFLWFDRDKPLPDQVLRFLHTMPCLQRVIVFGEVLPHDLENLLTALLDKGTDLPLRLQIFTAQESYRDRVNRLRGNIQARMTIADEPAQRTRRLEEILSVAPVSNPNLLPLAVREFMEVVTAGDFLAGAVHDRTVFLVPADAPGARFVAAACAPLARHLAAPVLLWNRATESAVLQHLKGQRPQRLFLLGGLSAADADAIEQALGGAGAASGAAPQIFRLPHGDVVSTTAALARMFRAHTLLDWLVRALRAEREQLPARSGTPLADLVRNYLAHLGDAPWAKDHLVPILRELLDGAEQVDLSLSYEDIFVGRCEFVASFRTFFAGAAARDPALLTLLAPVWNDLAVLADYDVEDVEHLNVYPAAALAAFHEAPLLLFPAISEGKEKFLEACVRRLERQVLGAASSPSAQPAPDAASSGGATTSGSGVSSTRNVTAVGASSPGAAASAAGPPKDEEIKALFAEAEDLASVIFPYDVQTTLEALNPHTLALYSSDLKVPYEAIADRQGPLSLRFALGRLTGANAHETSLITASAMLYAHDLQRQRPWKLLLCMANLPGTPQLQLSDEEQAIRAALQGERFAFASLTTPAELLKERVLDELAGVVHLFHYAGHGNEEVAQPQRSGIQLLTGDPPRPTPLNALEIKYRAKLGAHPLVFLNSCFGAGNSRIPMDPASGAPTEAAVQSAQQSQAAQTTEPIMGVSSSLIHIGAAAVTAPRWAINDRAAIFYAQHWYTYLSQGCSIGEAAWLARFDSIRDLRQSPNWQGGLSGGYGLLGYVIYGDPSLRLYPRNHLTDHYPATARRLLRLKGSAT
jgi:hypothetical protein